MIQVCAAYAALIIAAGAGGVGIQSSDADSWVKFVYALILCRHGNLCILCYGNIGLLMCGPWLWLAGSKVVPDTLGI